MINTDLENASKIMIGSQEAEAIYVGSNLIWLQSSPLPYDAEIEYLESTGTQWIDTGIIPTINTKSQIKFCNLNATGAVIFGYNTGDDHIDYRLFNYSSNLYFDIPGNLSFISEGNRLTSDTYKININSIYELELGNFYVKDLTTNNIIVNSTPCNNFGEINNSITLNAGYEDYSTYVISSNKWYYVKIYENNTLILNLIPVRIGQIGYMYDKVSGLLFGNQGTGNFVLGPDKDLPNGYTKLEYISSTNGGNLYIDLGIKLYEVLNTDYDIAIKFVISSTNTEGQATMFNCLDPNNSPWPGTYIRKNNSGSNITGRYIGGTQKDNTIGQLNNIIELPVLTSPNKNVTNINNNNSTHQYGTGLFCSFSDTNNTPQRYCNGILYYFKLFVNGTLVRDMIPCKNPNNVVGLYDVVNHRFYSSPNGNAFVAGPEIVPGPTANFLDILYSDSNGNLSIDSLVLATSEGKTPIGLCIAGTGFFGNNEPARWVSLRMMSREAPFTGTRESSMCWGNKQVDLSMTNILTTYSSGSSSGYLLDNNPGNSSPTIPSLFNSSDEWNLSVLGAANNYAVTDIDGKNKTDIMLLSITRQPNWQTDSSIQNEEGSGWAPAAACCARYYTLGTLPGDWYLGACGEMAMIVAQKSDIADKMEAIKNVYGDNAVSNITGNDSFLTSTEYDSDNVYYINPDRGRISTVGKDSGICVIAMLSY